LVLFAFATTAAGAAGATTATAFAARRTGSAIVAARTAIAIAAAESAAAVARTAAVVAARAAIAAATTTLAAAMALARFTRGRELFLGGRRKQRLAREADLAGVRLDADDLHFDLVADLEKIGDLADA